MKRIKGLSLVELLVSLAVGIILMTGVTQVFLSAKTSYTTQQGLGRIQENARFLVEMIGKDLRNSGFGGCGKLAQKITTKNLDDDLKTFVNYLNQESANLYDFSRPAIGFDNVSGNTVLATNTSVSPLAGTDVFILKTTTEITGILAESSESTPNSIKINVTNTNEDDCSYGGVVSDRVSGFCRGDIMMVSTCEKTFVFQATDINPTTGVIEHETNADAGSTFTPGNSSSTWKDDMAQDAELYKINTIAYYIRNDPATNRPALFAYSSDTTPAETLLISDVENMQIRYGVDTSTNASTVNDGTAEIYQTADSIVDPSKIVSVDFSFLLASPDPVLTTAQTISFNGTPATYSDKRLRQVVNFTVTVRNRMTTATAAGI